MRLFVAVDLDEPRRLAAARTAEEMGRRVGTTGPARAIKWVEPRNLHFTLRFIGEVDATRAARLRDALAPPFLTRAFDLALGGAGVFPPAGAPRVLWLGVAEGAAGLADLHTEIESRLRSVGEVPERRPFSAHLTLARIKDADRRVGDALRAAIRDVHIQAGACRVEVVTLYESRLAPSGPSYTPVLHSPLAGGA